MVVTRRICHCNINAADISVRLLRSRGVACSSVDRKNACLQRSGSKFFLSFQTVVGLSNRGYLRLHILLLLV